MSARSRRAPLRRLAALRTLVLAAVAALTQGSACGTELADSIAGKYALVSVDGAPLPATLEGGGQITGGQLEFESSNECGLILLFDSGTETDTCMWSRTGSAVLVTWDDDTIAFMTWSDEQVTYTRDGRELVFE